jgi:hypothetical protein
MEAPSLPCFKLTQTFFGLNPSDRQRLHENIFNLIWHGEGRWDWDTIYNMPIFLRSFWTKKVNFLLEQREEHFKKARSKKRRSSDNLPNVSR